MLRTHTCGELNNKYIGEKVTLCGWVKRIRKKGYLIWIDLRDRYGITQLIYKAEKNAKGKDQIVEKITQINREYVLKVKGVVIERSSKNPELVTGDIEVNLMEINILSTAKLPPFLVEDVADVQEDLRMEYRYLDLRRPQLQKNLFLKHQVIQKTHQFFSQRDFLYIETPSLVKSTPEGAKEFLVEDGKMPNHYYALAQSPQILKQLLMVGSLDKYYQIVKCFRDEDLRADRQPEFTQLDFELSFVDQEDILDLFECFIKFLFKELKGITLPKFQRTSYNISLSNYGTDKPDLRIGMPFFHIMNDKRWHKAYKMFNKDDLIMGICIKGGANDSRKVLDSYIKLIKSEPIGLDRLYSIKYGLDKSIQSALQKVLIEEDLQEIIEKAYAEPGDLVLFIVERDLKKARKALDSLRNKIGKEKVLQDEKIKKQYKPLWITDFDLFKYDVSQGHFKSVHHPFTMSSIENPEKLKKDPSLAKGKAYDLVINGLEIGGGSLRIHDADLQRAVLEVVGLSKQEIERNFGFLLEALKYGAPPHGGIAFGLDRLCCVLDHQESIRDYIAFPKNKMGKDVMMKAPYKLV